MNPTPAPEPRKKDLQITKTGVSGDYWNEFYVLLPTFEVGKLTREDRSGLNAVIEHIKDKPIKRYKERFTSEILDTHVVTSKNEETISQLNSIADRLNELSQNDSLTIKDLREAWNEAGTLIGGEDKYPKWIYAE